MNLIKKYEAQILEIRKSIISVGDQQPEFLEGCESMLKDVISDLKKQALNDRFFLEEIVFKILNQEEDHYRVLTRDFLSEYVNNLPMTEFEREQYIDKILGNSNLNYYFKSEKELAFYLKNNKMPNEEDLQDYSIVDCSTQAVC